MADEVRGWAAGPLGGTEGHPASAASAERDLQPLLAVDGLEVAYGEVQALWGVSLEVHAGEIVTLLGSNGAGKTTTLRTISRLLRPRAGRILFDGQEIQGLAPHAVVALGIAQVPEGRRLWPNLTVWENLRLGAYPARARADLETHRARLVELFPRLGERRDQLAGTLSGGEQQMVAIARALMSQPRLLMLDEPSLGLAPLVVKEVFEVVRTIRDAGTTVLLVEQNVNRALEVADRGYVLETGRVVLQGPSAELLANPEVRTAYLGF